MNGPSTASQPSVTPDAAQPCPFCGWQELRAVVWLDDAGEFDAIECRHCKGAAPASWWNHRAADIDMMPMNKPASSRKLGFADAVTQAVDCDRDELWPFFLPDDGSQNGKDPETADFCDGIRMLMIAEGDRSFLTWTRGADL